MDNSKVKDGEVVQFTLKGKRLGVHFALIGSVVFAIVDEISIQINSHWIKHIDTPPNEIKWALYWFMLVSVCGFCLAFFPARIGGGILASILYRGGNRHKISSTRGLILGAAIGGAVSLLICLPAVAIEYIFVTSTGHGDFYVYIFRTIEAVTIASFMGGLAGGCLSRQLQMVY